MLNITVNGTVFAQVLPDGSKLSGFFTAGRRPELNLWSVRLSAGSPDKDRHGNDIGGDSISAIGQTIEMTLARLLEAVPSRRAASRIHPAQSALRSAMKTGLQVA